jgi:hypothetical protein
MKHIILKYDDAVKIGMILSYATDIDMPNGYPKVLKMIEVLLKAVKESEGN